MNLRVDADVARGVGTQVQIMADRLASTVISADPDLRTARIET
jgi:hypothetical protein